MINALVLSGGGAKGSFEVGAIQYLYSQGFSPDIISGTSVGAINGVKLTEGEDSGKPTRGLAGLLALWLGLKGEQDMYVEVDVLQNLGINLDFALQTFSLRDGGAISASVDAIKNSITNSIFVWPVGFGSIITGILLSHLQSDLSTWFSEIDKAQAFYTLLPLENRARTDSNVLNTEFLQESPIRLFLAMVALETGSLLYADKLGQVFSSKNLKTPIASTDVVTAVFASAAAPLFFTPRKVMNFTCIDGGTRALIPVRVAVDAGADNIYAINCNAPVPRANIDTLTGIAFRSLDILVDEVGDGNLELCSAGGKVPCIRVVRPGLEIHDALTINPGLIRINIGYGFMRGFDDLELKLTPWARSYARLISDDIATLRKEILNKELAIGQMVPPQQVPPNANAKYIAAIRKMKCQLLWLLQRRHNIYGSQSLPHDYTQWPVVWTNPWENFYGATPWSALKIALGDAKGGHSPHVFAPKQTPCSVGTPLDAGMFPAFHMQQHALPEAHFNIRQPSSGYFLQSTMGKTGNYEVLLPQGNKLVHYFRDNDDPHLRWSLGGSFAPPASADQIEGEDNGSDRGAGSFNDTKQLSGAGQQRRLCAWEPRSSRAHFRPHSQGIHGCAFLQLQGWLKPEMELSGSAESWKQGDRWCNGQPRPDSEPVWRAGKLRTGSATRK